jgi:glutaredoxin 3
MRVLVYTSSSCPYCKKTKDFLKKNRVKFKEINISKYPSAAKELKKKTGQTGVPVTLAGNNKIIGFNEEKLRRVLKIK